MTTSSVHEPTSPETDATPDGTPAPPSNRVRAAIVINPYSSGMTAKREQVIVRTLREQMDLEVHRTERGGHAPKIAKELVEAGNLDVIITCGGDGTANEVLNGMSLASGTADSRPTVAILPAGGTNVVARALGFANHPIRATHQLAEAIVARRSQPINVATVDERCFLFAAGVGLDAEVVKRIEQKRSGRRPSDAAHMRAILGIYTGERFALEERMTITVDGTDEELRGALLLVGNMTPMTYVGRMPLHFFPDCALDRGLDFLAPRRVNALFAIRNAAQALGVGRAKQKLVKAEQAQMRTDVPGFTVECDDPQPVQVDGEYVGDRTHIRFGLLEHAVNLVVLD